ncbi:LAFE_0D02278g1_1 [Lachancea fermentati]|uniref:LAFE_0D02278g1_1 n=1 Tax=Lachancea fermentati TaxID=4955 RepID=A0A1G4MAQ1_LACFM|nr:LAFE_0D02278g1_1 [Lachancea fermentati]
MTRTQKWTKREAKAESRFFTHNGPYNQAPNGVKKDGSGKGNWGKPGDEIEDLIDAGEIPPVFHKERRGSNSQSHENRFETVQRTQK